MAFLEEKDLEPIISIHSDLYSSIYIPGLSGERKVHRID